MDCTVETFIPAKRKCCKSKRKDSIIESNFRDIGNGDISLSTFAYKSNKYLKFDENSSDATIACLLQRDELNQMGNVPASAFPARIDNVCEAKLPLPVVTKERLRTTKKTIAKAEKPETVKVINRKKIVTKASSYLRRSHKDVFLDAINQTRLNGFGTVKKTPLRFTAVDYSRKAGKRALKAESLLWEACGKVNIETTKFMKEAPCFPCGTNFDLCQCKFCLESSSLIGVDLMKLLTPAYSVFQDAVFQTSSNSVPVSSLIYKLRANNPMYTFREFQPHIICHFVVFLYSGVLPANLESSEIEQLLCVANESCCSSLISLINQHRGTANSSCRFDRVECSPIVGSEGKDHHGELIDSLWFNDTTVSQPTDARFQSQFILLSPSSLTSETSLNDNDAAFDTEENEFLDFLDRTQANKSLLNFSASRRDDEEIDDQFLEAGSINDEPVSVQTDIPSESTNFRAVDVQIYGVSCEQDSTQPDSVVVELSDASSDLEIADSDLLEKRVDCVSSERFANENCERSHILSKRGASSDNESQPLFSLAMSPVEKKGSIAETDSDDDIVEIPLSQRLKLSSSTHALVETSSFESKHSELKQFLSDSKTTLIESENSSSSSTFQTKTSVLESRAYSSECSQSDNGIDVFASHIAGSQDQRKRCRRKAVPFEDLAEFVRNRRDIWANVLQYRPLNLLSFINNFEEQNPHLKLLEKDAKVFFDEFGIICSEKTISTV